MKLTKEELPEFNSERYLLFEDLDGEEWRDIKGFEGAYQVSNYARVRSVERDRHCINQFGHYVRHIPQCIMRVWWNNCGYILVSIRNGKGKEKKLFLHKILAEAFIPNPNNYPQVDHINTDKSDCTIENLRWVTAKMNSNNPLTIQHQKKARIEVAKRESFRMKLSIAHKIIKNRPEMKAKMREVNRYHFQPVAQYMKDGTFVKAYECLADANRETSIHRSAIRRCCQGALQTSGGYVWKFV